MFKVDFEKAEEPETKFPMSVGSYFCIPILYDERHLFLVSSRRSCRSFSSYGIEIQKKKVKKHLEVKKHIFQGKFGLGIWNVGGQRLIEFCQENTLVTANILF